MIEQTETPPNNDPTAEAPLGPLAPNKRALLLLAAILAVAVLGYLFLSSQTAAQRPLKPPRPTATPNVIAISSQPVIVTFAQLNEDPFALLNRTIRVTGSYTPLELPTCDGPYSGPTIVWALIAEELQLDVRGFEHIMRLVPPGTTLTVEGIWRLYEGPHGCGKEPPTATVWYLELSRIIQPNPLPLLSGTAVPLDTLATPTFAPTTDPATQPIGTPPIPGATTDPATTPIPTATGFGIPTASATVQVGATATIGLPLTVTTTPSPGPSPTATATTNPNATRTPTATATGTATATLGSGTAAPTATTLPVAPTNTPNGTAYPVEPTPTSQSGYP